VEVAANIAAWVTSDKGVDALKQIEAQQQVASVTYVRGRGVVIRGGQKDAVKRASTLVDTHLVVQKDLAHHASLVAKLRHEEERMQEEIQALQKKYQTEHNQFQMRSESVLRAAQQQFERANNVSATSLRACDTAHALPVIRIVAPAGNYDYQNKYFTDDTQYLVPSGLPEAEEKAIQAHVVKAYQVLGCKGWGRIDVMIDAATRQPYLLEINTSPGMTSHSLVPMSAKAAGMDYESLCMHLLANAGLEHAVTHKELA
jgi:hypothetical protein